jgi:small-conductance mechanosensitive channel
MTSRSNHDWQWFLILAIAGIIIFVVVILQINAKNTTTMLDFYLTLLILLFASAAALLSSRLIFSSKRFDEAERNLVELREKLVGSRQKGRIGEVDQYWFKGEITINEPNLTPEELERARIPGGIRGLVLSVIKSRQVKFSEANADVWWLSPSKKEQLARGDDTGGDTWWRLFGLFKESASIYMEPCSVWLAGDRTEEHRHASLQCEKDTKTASLSPYSYEKGKSALFSLLTTTREYVYDSFKLKEMKITFPFVFLITVFVAVSVLAGLSTSFGDRLGWTEAIVFALLSVFAGPVMFPALRYLVHTRTPMNVGWAEKRILAEGVAGFFSVMTVALSLYHFVNIMPSGFKEVLASATGSIWGDPLARILTLSVAAAVLILMMRDLIAIVFERVVGSKELVYDETFLGVIQNFGIVYVLIIFSAAVVLSFQKELGISAPDTVVVIYVFIGTLVTGVLGYASRASLEDFFSGVMLKVNPPFKEGDRIILPSSEVCDVVEIGTTMVRLYNVTLNAEIFIPNKKIADMTITNVSRPDLELRLQLSAYVKPKESMLHEAELVLIDCAYFEDEVDQAVIDDKDFKTKEARDYWERHERTSINSELKRLTQQYPDLRLMGVPKGENAVQETEQFDELTQHSLDGIRKARTLWTENPKNEEERKKALKEMIYHFGRLAGAVFSIADYRPELKEEAATLVTELSKEPTVHSRFEVNSGETYIVVTLNVFTIHLERRYEVENKLNKRILDELDRKGLLFTSSKANTPDSEKTP